MTARLTSAAALVGSAVLATVPAATSAPPSTYAYLHLDVFTDETLSGNQLAVFLDPGELDAETMQAIAREMNFSETTFVFPASREDADFRVRIFGRNRELAFAGHPTIGTAFALAEKGRIPPGTPRVVFEEGIGPVAVELEWEGERLDFAWMEQRRPAFGEPVEAVDELARALGLEPADIRETGLPVQEVSCGSTFLLVPLRSAEAVDRVAVDGAALGRFFERAGMERRGVFVFTTREPGEGATAYSRMLGGSGFEDPATGSAAGPLGSYLAHHKLVPPSEHERIVARQGVRMGRPSRIHIRIGTDETGAIDEVWVGGRSVVVGEGTVRVPPSP